MRRLNDSRIEIPTDISAIFFDAGDTLVRPASGHWYIPPRFNEILDSYNMRPPDLSRLEAALKSGADYLDAHHQIQTEDEELDQFVEYYGIVFSYLGGSYDVPNKSSSLYQDLARDMVLNDDKFVFFPDVNECIEHLNSASVPIGILSNTWPSLERVFRHAGLYDFFDAFIVSSRVGCFKPDPRIYADGIAKMGIEPDKILFVDDSEENLAGGARSGMRPLLINRYADYRHDIYPCISELSELPDLPV